MRRFLLFWVIILCAGSLVFSQADRNKRYVAVQTAVLKDSTGFFAKEVGNLSLGTEVTVLIDGAKWTQVQAENVSGWVASASLSVRRVVTASSTVTASEIALAGKGDSSEVEIEYKKNGLDYSAVDSMEKMTILANDLLRFITEGRLSRGE